MNTSILIFKIQKQKVVGEIEALNAVGRSELKILQGINIEVGKKQNSSIEVMAIVGVQQPRLDK